MADAKKTKREQFENAVYELGLTLIDDYRAGRCRDRDKTLEAIIEIFKVQTVGGNDNVIRPATL